MIVSPIRLWDFIEPALNKRCMDAVVRVLDSRRFVGGVEVKNFERTFADYIGVAHCRGVGSGADALLLTYRAMGIGPSSIVVVQVNTFAAAATAAKLLGAEVRFVDCHEDGSLDRGETLAACEGASLLVGTHLWGSVVERAFIERIPIPVVEDCSQAHGATFTDGSRAGSAGVASIFSFYPSKILGAWGDAGAVCTSDDVIADRVSILRDHGRHSNDRQLHVQHAYNSRLDAIQAAVLRAKLPSLAEQIIARRVAAAVYRDLGMPSVAADPRYVYPVCVADRKAVAGRLLTAGVEYGIHYAIPLHKQPAFASEGYESFPVAEKLSNGLLSLPLHPYLTRADQERVVEAVLGT